MAADKSGTKSSVEVNGERSKWATKKVQKLNVKPVTPKKKGKRGGVNKTKAAHKSKSPTKASKASNGKKEEDGEYEVEKVLGIRIDDGELEYHIKWKGFAEKYNSWEGVGNLDCPDKVKEFEAEVKKLQK
uniref:Chromo domain-containing protein n=1 Tax=Acrobeloides nanus TaxID=290746 RepID=A0A914CIL0_9BILA